MSFPNGSNDQSAVLAGSGTSQSDSSLTKLFLFSHSSAVCSQPPTACDTPPPIAADTCQMKSACHSPLAWTLGQSRPELPRNTRDRKTTAKRNQQPGNGQGRGGVCGLLGRGMLNVAEWLPLSRLKQSQWVILGRARDRDRYRYRDSE